MSMIVTRLVTALLTSMSMFQFHDDDHPIQFVRASDLYARQNIYMRARDTTDDTDRTERPPRPGQKPPGQEDVDNDTHTSPPIGLISTKDNLSKSENPIVKIPESSHLFSISPYHSSTERENKADSVDVALFPDTDRPDDRRDNTDRRERETPIRRFGETPDLRDTPDMNPINMNAINRMRAYIDLHRQMDRQMDGQLQRQCSSSSSGTHHRINEDEIVNLRGTTTSPCTTTSLQGQSSQVGQGAGEGIIQDDEIATTTFLSGLSPPFLSNLGPNPTEDPIPLSCPNYEPKNPSESNPSGFFTIGERKKGEKEDKGESRQRPRPIKGELTHGVVDGKSTHAIGIDDKRRSHSQPKNSEVSPKGERGRRDRPKWSRDPNHQKPGSSKKEYSEMENALEERRRQYEKEVEEKRRERKRYEREMREVWKINEREESMKKKEDGMKKKEEGMEKKEDGRLNRDRKATERQREDEKQKEYERMKCSFLGNGNSRGTDRGNVGGYPEQPQSVSTFLGIFFYR